MRYPKMPSMVARHIRSNLGDTKPRNLSRVQSGPDPLGTKIQHSTAQHIGWLATRVGKWLLGWLVGWLLVWLASKYGMGRGWLVGWVRTGWVEAG